MRTKMSIEVFKTDVYSEEQATRLAANLQRIFPDLLINFDLGDCDRIMRVQGQQIDPAGIQQISHLQGHQVSPLPD